MHYPGNTHEDETPPQLSMYGKTGFVSRRVPATVIRPVRQYSISGYDARYTTEQPMYEEYYETEDQYSNQGSAIYGQAQPSTRYIQVVPVPPPTLQHQTSGNQNVPPNSVPTPAKQITTKDVECPYSSLSSSPVCFSEYVPGAWEQIVKERSLLQGKSGTRSKTELDAADVKLVNELGQLSVDNLLDYMKNLQNNAFVLGQDETKEFQRAKCLNLFKK
ncbi:hypothetical protein FO519_006200 [Halicephalobus sp. NKZ332]|nr:hypothetical protein FO519_006200 [Halicephalobus sp. NKZ332]